MTSGENGPVGFGTKVGQILTGVVRERKKEIHVFISQTHVLKIANERYLKNSDENVKNFWGLESIGIKENEKSMYQELPDEICINKEARYKVNLPYKNFTPSFTRQF